MNETDLLHIFIERVPHTLPDVRVFQRRINNAPSTIDGRTFRVRTGVAGQGDAYALVRGGLHVEIETKAATGRMRPSQLNWRAWCARWNVPHLVLRARKGEEPSATIGRWIAELQAAILGAAHA